MSKISNPILALAATALLLGINLSLQSAHANESDSPATNETNGARADNCLSVRPASTPKGQHWYFRTERGHKCWSLHAGAHHAAARPHPKAAPTTHNKPAAPEEATEPPPPTNTQNDAFGVTAPPPPPTHTQPAPEAASAAATMPGAAAEAAPGATVAGAPPPGAVVQPQPHIEILRTEPAGAPTQPAAQPSAPAAQEAPATQGAPAAQGGSTADGNATSTDGADPAPSNAGSEAKDAAVPEVGPDTQRDESDAAQEEPAETPGLADKIATLQPTEMFFLFAIGLSVVIFLVAIASRIAAKRREPIITEYPAWSNDQFDPPRLEAPQFAHEAIDEQWTDEEQDAPFIDPRALDDPHEQDPIGQPALTHKATAPLSAPGPRSDSKDLEPVLRILRRS